MEEQKVRKLTLQNREWRGTPIDKYCETFPKNFTGYSLLFYTRTLMNENKLINLWIGYNYINNI